MDTVLLIIGLATGGYLAFLIAQHQHEMANRGADKILCPHCQTRGSVAVEIITRKKGLSGGKATAGLLTGGASLFAVGLSRKQGVRHLKCMNCYVEWDVE